LNIRFSTRLLPALLALFLFACEQPLTIEQQVIATIRQMEEKIEAGERRNFMGYVAADFRGQSELMTREQLRALVVFQLNRNKRLSAQLFPIRVEETGEGLASAFFRALVTGGPGWIPERGQVYDFETHWRLEDDEWLLARANWEPVPLDEALDKLPTIEID
jgi:hypothetical protein